MSRVPPEKPRQLAKIINGRFSLEGVGRVEGGGREGNSEDENVWVGCLYIYIYIYIYI